MIYVAKQYCVVKQEENPDEFFYNDYVQDKVAMDNDGNFLPEIDPEVFLSSIELRILPWFVTKITI